ncbi:MAG: alanine--tRNA ligase [Candidatus Jordarchaeales archaeon]
MTVSKEELRKNFGKEKYEVELFRREGFVRNRCEVCGDYFWTLDPDRKNCGDTKCVGGYLFLGKKTSMAWDFHESIEKWCRFFEERGHKRIKAYPVVARWRDDIAFTIASIADFQPYVVEGVVRPPANPLVVPQPCIRFGGKGFCDIDNVGRTGRHLSLFIMGGQHAFNYNGEGYWMDRCMELNFEFLTKVLNLEKEEITYKEDVWSGGGTFGPSLEAFGRGLEIVNNVFMQYAFNPDGSWRELKIRVIDVGWGIERVSWFMQGTPTIYEAAFGPILEWLKKEAGVTVDEDLILRYFALAGVFDATEMQDLEKVVREIASKLDVSTEELKRQLLPLEALYAIADHTRTLVFAVADGGIPSNVGGGYNLRVILRRALSLDKLYGFELNFTELFHKQIEYFSRSYPHLKVAAEIIDDVFAVEKERYLQSLAKGRSQVERLLKKKSLDVETLIKLYESNGITPEMVQEIGEEMGIKIEVPSNFYLELGGRQEKKDRGVVSPGIVIDENIPPTYPLYYDRPYDSEFTGRVIAIIGPYVILDRTLFYPTGGGQLYDVGSLNGETVVKVEKVGNVILHQVNDVSKFHVGQEVKGKIDWERRIALMRHHTATHILNGAARRVLGPHVWQAGAEKRFDEARLDVTHYKPLTNEEVARIEELANKIVMENRRVSKYVMPRDEAENKFGFTIYQGGAVPGGELRIVDVEGWDVEACGGIHVDYTGEVGIIKIVKTERIQDGVVRFEFKAGDAAIRYIQDIDRLLNSVASVFKVPKENVLDAAKRFFEEWKDRGKEIEKLKNYLAKMEAERLLNKVIPLEGYVTIVERVDTDRETLVKIADSLVKKNENLVVILLGRNGKVEVVGMRGNKVPVDVSAIVREISVVVGGSGGGKENIAMGGGELVEKIDEAMRRALELLRKSLKG